jgi:hypothetical protein
VELPSVADALEAVTWRIWGILDELETADLIVLGARETPRLRRKGERPAQDLADSPEALLRPWRTSHLAKAIHALEFHAARSMKMLKICFS